MCKRVLCLMFVCALGLPQVASAELVGWWKLDDGTGTVAKDSSGNGLDGNFVGNPRWVEGMNGTGGLELDGNSYVDFGAPPQTLFTGAMPLSAALWINPANLGTVLAGAGHDRAFLGRNQNWAFKASGPYARLTTPGVLDYNAQKTVLKIGEWQHVAVTFQPGVGKAGQAVFYLDSVETDRVNSGAANGGYNAGAATAGGPVLLGNNQWSAASNPQFFIGRCDDVRLYNHILTADEVKQLAFRAKAYKPSPADKAVGVSQALLQWTAGTSAMLHNVYVGTSPELTQANLIGDKLPFAMTYYTTPLQPGTVYYWRVDEVEADGKTVYTGDVWSFTATAKTAWAPKPADTAAYIPTTAQLEWTPGMNATLHDLYLATDRAAVEAGAAAAKKGEKLSTTTYKPTALEQGKTYYWRVDETLFDGTMVPGSVWSFAVRPVIAKADPNLIGWWKLDDEKSGTAVDYSGYDRDGTLQGNPQWVEGQFGGALQFNGTSTYVDLGTPAALYLPKTYTYCLWFKLWRNIAGNSGPQYLLCMGSRSDLIFGVEDAVGLNGDLMLHYYDTAPGFRALRVGQTVWAGEEWHMVTATKDAAGHKIYLDGELKNSDTNTRDDNYNTTRMIAIGGRAWTSPKVEFFNGTIDDVRIYNKALSADQIKQLMRGDPLIAWNPQPKSSATLDIRDAASLTWSAGDNAAKHDVYFGKNKDAVKAADTTSPLYQGRQAGTSFALDGKVEFAGGSYFWRIDEVEADGKTVHRGLVWSFTVPGYLIVDEFEGYDDQAGTEIFSTWIDGFADNYKSSGSTVGYTTAVNLTFAETAIIHGGKQSMPMDYDNTKAPFFSEAVQTFSPLEDWTVGAVTDLSLWFRGRLAAPALVEAPAGQYKIGTNTADTWGAADSFRFYYTTLTGDGSITAKIISTTNSNAYAKAGVMIRENLTPGSTNAFMYRTPDGRRVFQNRPLADAASVRANSATNQATVPFWVRVERKGNQFTGYYSTDGKTWTRQPDTENTGADRSLNPQLITMGSSVCLGIALTSNNTATVCTAEFSDVTATGSVSGDWKLVSVGAIYSNDPDKLYVVVEDSAGKSAIVTHSDPAATGLTTWTEWKIPLSSLAGVNVAKIKKVYVGVGDRKATAPTGTGRMYFDDIRVVK